MNKKNIAITLIAALTVAAACAHQSTGGLEVSNQNQAVVREANAVRLLASLYANEHGGAYVAFSTKSLPAWGNTEAKLSALTSPSLAKLITKATTRTWEYRVNPLVVGKSYDIVTPDTMVSEVRNAPATITLKGITKNGDSIR